MRIGVPKEIKNNEFRVAITPEIAHELSSQGHDIFIEQDAGLGSGFTDKEYHKSGAIILPSPDKVFEQSQLILKVKEPQESERNLLNENHTLFTYLHLAPDPIQTNELISSRATCIAYETVIDETGRLPLLTPMSEIAGRMAAQAGANCLEKVNGGRGVLLSGAPGVAPADVLVLGGGVVGKNAAKIALGMGASVTIADKSLSILRSLEEYFDGKVKTLFSNKASLLAQLPASDLVIGAVLIPGASAPKLITKNDLALMRPGSVLVDVAIDQGGCFETSKPTTHQDPIFIIDEIVHYCVANMPGAVARTSTLALTNATLPYIQRLANKGVRSALEDDNGFLQGLSVTKGYLCNQQVAISQNIEAITLREALDLL